MTYRLPVYKQYDIEIDRAKGNYIWDKSGKRYVDFISGISVTNFGHLSAEIVSAVTETLEKYMHLSNLYHEGYQKKLAEELVKRTFDGKVFFSNSGAEANECAIKVARKYFGGDKYEIISFKNSFHGRTLATLAATGQTKFHEGFGPMPEGFVHVEYNYLAAVRDKLNSRTCAVLVEPIQGEGGVIPANADFMEGLRALCDEKGILLIADEIQTGMGRTGEFLASDHYSVKPDIVVMGKALGGGMPLGATLIASKFADCMEKGDHGSTFGGNPVCCAAAIASLAQLDQNRLFDIKKKGRVLKNGCLALKKEHGLIEDVRGEGLMIGMELKTAGADMVEYCRENGFLVNCTQDKVIRFLPPFTIDEREIDQLIEVIREYFKEKG